MKTGRREEEDENRCIDRARCHGGRRRAGFHEQRLQEKPAEKPAQLVCPDLKGSASRQKLNGPNWPRCRTASSLVGTPVERKHGAFS
jgi:hypothetical protein